MIKKLLFVAFGCIIISIVGISVYGLDYGNELPSYENEWTFSAEELENLEISSEYDTNIKFIQSQNNKNSIKIEGHITKESIEIVKKTSIINKTLNLNLQTPKAYHFLDYITGPQKQYITVALTDATLLNSLKVDAENKDVDLNDIKVEHVKITTNAGGIYVKGLQANSFFLKSQSGNATLNDIVANTQFNSLTGNAIFNNYSGKGNFQNQSGDMKVVQKGIGDIDITTESGNVIVVPSSEFMGILDLQSKQGTIQAPKSSKKSTDTIKVYTNSGNINIVAR
ncbi:DUF4097 family beta strand repeat-containing protein [Bacillus cereus group sp. BfR-BA-01380]|uniref:DUF4097 family beta strand repeat-containing protein n=1 Tax=Bacillus cereus group sp. BfR-BA-01380 TaxID=2920324 RepID=UPI001F58EAAE|nr:DUF4097 family beta strand repeat-containing protein [Bacillus cereus group sp. BfR-BA-01380]